MAMKENPRRGLTFIPRSPARATNSKWEITPEGFNIHNTGLDREGFNIHSPGLQPGERKDKHCFGMTACQRQEFLLQRRKNHDKTIKNIRFTERVSEAFQLGLL